VLRGSSAGSRPSIRVSPSAMAPNSRARWEIDLSPGTRTVPPRLPPPLSGRGLGWAAVTTTGRQALVGRSYGPCSALLPAMALLCSLLVALLLLVAPGASPAAAAGSADPLQVDHYLCEGEPLRAALYAGAVDATGIPNTVAGTVPGAYVVLQWRDISLQLPRTNNAGPPSYTDGRWWWSPVDPEQPEFKQRRASVTTYNCLPDPG
jgi:hypothetical protein